MLSIVCAAFAAPNPSPATALPTAVSVEGGQAELSTGIAAGVIILPGVGGGGFGGADLRVGVAPVDGLWVSASATAMRAGFATFVPSSSQSAAVVPTLSVSYDIVRSPTLSTGPVALAGVAFPGIPALGSGLGWSVSGRAGSVALDATLVGGLLRSPEDGAIPLAALESGIWFGADRPNRVRLGVFSALAGLDGMALPLPAVDLAYRHEAKRWYFEAGSSGLIVVQGARVEFGMRF